jgi:hypothetical protein
MDHFNAALEKAKAPGFKPQPWDESRNWTGMKALSHDPSSVSQTGVKRDIVDNIAQAITAVPPSFNLHSKLGNLCAIA